MNNILTIVRIGASATQIAVNIARLNKIVRSTTKTVHETHVEVLRENEGAGSYEYDNGDVRMTWIEDPFEDGKYFRIVR